MEGENVAAAGLSSYMGSLEDLTIPNYLHSYDTFYGTTIILNQNNTIYMGDMMEYYLTNTLQSEENRIHIDIHTKK